MNLNIDDDDKLTVVQLRVLLNMKRRKTDKPISSLKKQDILLSWKEWKTQPLKAPEYANGLVESINEATQATTISARETTASNECIATIIFFCRYKNKSNCVTFALRKTMGVTFIFLRLN